MKNIITITTIIMAMALSSQAQNINWRTVDSLDKNIVSLGLGYDYGVTTQLGYYRSIKAFKPILLGGDFSFPSGKNLMDDHKVRIGGQIEIFDYKGFSVSGKIFGNFRRHESELVRMASFGSELSLVSGYYKPTWHIGVEVGFDKAIATHLKHSDIVRETFYADIQDGWYVATAGNWFYGFQASKTIGKSMGITARFGLTNAEGKDKDAMLPYYAQLGLNKKF